MKSKINEKHHRFSAFKVSQGSAARLLTLFACLMWITKPVIPPVISTSSLISLKHASLTSQTSTFTVNLDFNTASFVSNMYTIQEGKTQAEKFSILKTSENLTSTSFQVTLTIKAGTVASSFSVNLKIAILATSSQYLQFGVFQFSNPITNSQYNISLKRQYEYPDNAKVSFQYFSLFTHTVEIDYNFQQISGTQLAVTFSKIPAVLVAVNIPISLGLIAVKKQLIMNQVFLTFDKIVTSNSNFQLVLGKWLSYSAGSQNCFLGINKYVDNTNNGHPKFDQELQIKYNYMYTGNMLIGYKKKTANINIQSTLILFNQTYQCPHKSFLQYSNTTALSLVYHTSPIQNCQVCHFSCLKCISFPGNPMKTDQNHCFQCQGLRYLSPQNSLKTYGKCQCFPGLNINTTSQQCQQCGFQCLSFDVSYLGVTQIGEFMMVFSYTKLTLLTIFQLNLKVTVDGKAANYNFTNPKNAVYIIRVQNTSLVSCETQCNVTFFFKNPQLIMVNNTNITLSQRSKSVQLKNAYILEDYITEQIKTSFDVVSFFMVIAASTGSSSMIKMLFELQQTIEFHKHLNLQMPLIFKQFIEALGSFQFLDFTTLFPIDITATLQLASNNQIDTYGSIKSKYYQSGANFYKNIIGMVFSLVIILLIYLLTFLILRVIPCQFTYNFSQKIWLRRYITVHDTVQSIILPIIVFGIWQLLNMIPVEWNFWIYSLAPIFMIAVLCLPFITVIYVYNRRNIKQTQQSNADLVQDCKLNKKQTYFYYITVMYNKIFFGFMLCYKIPGLVQISIVLVSNILFFLFIVYVIKNRVFASKIKILIRTVNILCLLGIQIMILIYNLNEFDKTTKVNIGLACTYLAITATIAGIIQIILRIIEVICQKVYQYREENQDELEKKQNEPDADFVASNQQQIKEILKCHLGDQLNGTTFNYSESRGRTRQRYQSNKSKNDSNALIFMQEDGDQNPSDLVSVQDSQNNLRKKKSNQDIQQIIPVQYFQKSEAHNKIIMRAAQILATRRQKVNQFKKQQMTATNIQNRQKEEIVPAPLIISKRDVIEESQIESVNFQEN